MAIRTLAAWVIQPMTDNGLRLTDSEIDHLAEALELDEEVV